MAAGGLPSHRETLALLFRIGLLLLTCTFFPALAFGQDERAAAAEQHVPPWLDLFLEWTARGIEIAGICIIVLGAVISTATYLRCWLGAGATSETYHAYRASLGRAILLGLEFLVAADIIATVAVDPTLDSLIVLAGIVLIRTFLSFSLEVEIQGRWPWQEKRADEVARTARG